jgi:hypothetical protein
VVSNLDQVFVVVQDFQADERAPMDTYTLRLRTRNDPDENEPNEAYHPLHVLDGPDVDVDLGEELEWSECASGTLAYENDRDFFTLPHPCPDNPNGCTLRVESIIGPGPVEVLANLGPYGDLTRLGESGDLDVWEDRTSIAGGNAECLPANSYMADPLRLVVRDLEPNRDFAADQPYLICFHIEHNYCAPPCVESGADGQCFYE